MENKIMEIMKEKPITIPRILFRDYKKLNITEEEFIVLIYMMDLGNKVPYNPDIFVEQLGFDKFRAMELINNLIEKKIISMSLEQNKKGIREEYLNIDLLYNKLFNNIITVEDEEVDNSNIFSKFESEFGRPISPMEYEIIKGWINDKFSEEIITEALKEAVYNNVNNLRYIDKILYDWKKKGFKNRNDIVKDKVNIKKEKTKNISLFDYNWLEDE